MSLPRNMAEPEDRTPEGSSRMMARALSDFPLPDSPTIPTVSALFTSRSMPVTIGFTPPAPWYSTTRLRTLSKFPAGGVLGLSVTTDRLRESFVDPVADQAEAHSQQDNRQAGAESRGRVLEQEGLAVRQHRTPLGAPGGRT